MRFWMRAASAAAVLITCAGSAAMACTSFVLPGPDGPVFATNLDNRLFEGLVYVNKRGMTKSGWEAGTTGEYARWPSRYGSVTFNFAGYQIAWAGMNEAGLVLSTMFLDETQVPDPDERPGLESGFWMQYQLDNCATVDDVVAAAGLVRMTKTVDHYLVCDARGAIAVIEFLDGRMAVHRGEELPFPVLTNHTYRRLVKSQRWWSFKRIFGERYPANPSLKRFQLAVRSVKSFDAEAAGTSVDAVDAAFRTLAEVSGQRVNGSPTQWSIVFDTGARLVHFRTRTHEPVRTLDFGSLDFAPETPVMMMDIHEKVSGGAAEALFPYSHERTLEHYLKFFEGYGSDVPPERTRQLVEYLESFHAWE